MTYQDLVEIPRIQFLAQQYRSSNLRFEGYLNFALSKAIQMAGGDRDRSQIISEAVAILEGELQRRTVSRKSTERKRSTGFLGLGRRRSTWV